MRTINITIQKRFNVSTDNDYQFLTFGANNESTVYQLESLILNYSVTSSQVTGTLILGMNEPVSSTNVLRSGQPITVLDNGITVFEGILLSPQYTVLPMTDENPGGSFLFATIAPSIYQLTITPLVFDNTQIQQINTLTGTNISNILVSGVTQKIPTDSLLSYMVSNTTYNNVFNHTINAEDLADNLFLITSLGEMRDTALRHSIDYYNCVLYQQEDGIIKIRQLDASIDCPFDLDLQNLYNVDLSQPVPPNTIPIAALLTYQYQENAFSTPAVISNYAMLDPNIASAQSATPGVLTYATNPKFFPQIANLQKTGWFVGQIGMTQLNNNVVEDPTTAQALETFFKYPDAYMLASPATGVSDQGLASYQALLTAKQMGMAITGYSSLSGTISLDDPSLANVDPADLGKVVGTIVQIQNCDMQAGLMATVSRSYNAIGSYLSFNITPLGSYTGYWRNSLQQPTFV